MFGWAIKAGLWDERNPASSIPRNRERSRDRFLQGDEMPRFFRALAEERNETIRDYMLISLFTGARQGNVLTMKWSHIDFTSRIWFIPETKNGTAHMVPLTMERSPSWTAEGNARPSGASTAIYARLSVEPVRKAVEAANAAILRAAGEQLSLVSAPNVS